MEQAEKVRNARTETRAASYGISAERSEAAIEFLENGDWLRNTAGIENGDWLRDEVEVPVPIFRRPQFLTLLSPFSGRDWLRFFSYLVLATTGRPHRGGL
jgi:hypothetical protein